LGIRLLSYGALYQWTGVPYDAHGRYEADKYYTNRVQFAWQISLSQLTVSDNCLA
jgi:hypothetical protein